MKLLFVDHAFHRKTKSSSFFTAFLAQYFEIEIVFLDPEDLGTFKVLGALPTCDVVVLWQMDFLAPLFLAQQLPTVVVPMYDGSATMPDLHWIWSREARFVNFSRRLNDRISGLGGTTFLARYFAKPPQECDVSEARFERLRVFLWQRRPYEGINLRLAERLVGAQATSIHIHNAADDGTIDTAPYLVPSIPGYELTVSQWLDSAADYEALIAEANVFIAPRLTEGIGMAVIEAMGRGMIVIAADSPTHDEYIANWQTGILFNPQHYGVVDLHDVGIRRALGTAARKAAVRGYRTWQDQQPELVDFIRSTPRPQPPAEPPDILAMGQALVRAYYEGGDRYLGYMLQNLSAIENMAGISLDREYEPYFAGLHAERQRLFRGRLSPANEKMPWLEGGRLDAEALVDRRWIVSGGVFRWNEVLWMQGQRLVLGFRMEPGVARTLRVALRSPNPGQTSGYCLMLNGWTLAIGAFTGERHVIEVAVQRQVLRHDNELHVQSDSFEVLAGPQVVSLGVDVIEFV